MIGSSFVAQAFTIDEDVEGGALPSHLISVSQRGGWGSCHAACAANV